MQKGFAPLAIIFGVVVIVGLAFSGYWYLNKSKSAQEKQQTTSIAPASSPTPSSATLTDSDSTDNLNLSTTIKIPFVRDGSIYLYEEGREKLIAKPKQASTDKACYSLIYPFLSPNGKFI